ncbi:MAG: hypothetical protein ACRDWA_01375 [Acidimicrobiia bacterium]
MADHAEYERASNWWRRLFIVSVWGLLGSLYFFSPALLVLLGWFQEPFSELGNAETVSHRVHEIVFGCLFATAFVGAASQVRSQPKIGGALQALLTVVAFFVVLAFLGEVEGLGFLFLAFALAVVFAHPEPWRRWAHTFQPTWGSVLLAVAGIVPLAAFAVEQIVKAQLEAANHVTHWGGVAAWSVALGLMAMLAALRPPGHRLVEFSVGGNGLLFVAASEIFPFDASARPGFFGFWLVIWSMVWLLRSLGASPRFFRYAAVAPLLLGLGALGSIGAVILIAVAAALVRSAGFRRRLLQAAPGAALFLLTTVSLIAGLESNNSNVPHGLEGVAFVDIASATCIDCHAAGREGATLIPHEPDRTCTDDCWGARSDCIGCHRYDPALGGPSELVAIIPRASQLPARSPALTAFQVATLTGQQTDDDG